MNKPGGLWRQIPLPVKLITAFLGAALLYGAFADDPDSRSIPPARPAAPRSVAEITDRIDTARVEGGALHLAATVENAFGDAANIDSAAAAARAAGEAIQDGAAGADAATVALTVRTSTVDRLGEVSTTPIVRLTFAGEDMRRARFDNLDFAGVINLASRTEILHPIGRRFMVAWCLKDQNMATAPAPCRAALDDRS